FAAFERCFGFKVLEVTANASDSGELIPTAEGHRCLFFFQIARNNRVIIPAAMTDVTNLQIEMIAPEKRRHDKRLARSENITRSGLALALRHDPMFHPDPARARIG